LDPLFKIDEAYRNGNLPEETYRLILERAQITYAGIDRIEKASGIHFPISYIDPSILVTPQDPVTFQFGILYARTIPLILNGTVQVVIQICAPLVSYGLKGTIHAVLAHEFLHYLELLKRMSQMRMLSDEISGSIFENTYADESRLFEPGAVFQDRTLLRHITKRFPAGFRDYKLEDKVIEFWIEKGLPQSGVALDSNFARMSAESISSLLLDPVFLKRLEEIEQKSLRIRKRRGY
jgi:hypothetical protein